ncbi:MAG TPA: MFS transporter [Chloroflexota bacterium]|nr:MFS transporter [Chloroflexota bacterium]
MSREMPYASSPIAPPAAPTPTVATEPSPAPARGLALWIVCISHGLNHLQGNMTNLLYPLMMAELGFGYFQIGLLTTAFTLTTNGLQAIYGLLTPYMRRSVLLGLGNSLMALATAATGLVHSYWQLFVTRIISGIGSSPQHPVGSTLLIGLFPHARGRALALHTTGGNVGTLAAPLIVGALVAFLDSRTVFLLVALPSLAVGLAYLLVRDQLPLTVGRRPSSQASWQAYLACLRNRNLLIISLVQMVGAAGRGQGIDIAFLTPHFVNDFQLDLPTATLLITILQAGGLFGPLALGWLSDRTSRKPVLLASLALSALATYGLAVIGAPGPLLLANLLVYGIVVNSRLVLTQALIADSAGREAADAAFSLYFFVGFISAPLWTLIFGWLMEHYGFTIGFMAMGATYVVAMGLIAFIRTPQSGAAARA